MFIVYKETLKNALIHWKEEEYFNAMMDETNEIGAIIHSAKKDNVNAGIVNYGRIPDRYFSKSFIQCEDINIDRLFVMIGGYILTFCGKFKRIKIKNILDLTDISIDDMKSILEKYGDNYGLSYLEERDRFRRINKYIVLK